MKLELECLRIAAQDDAIASSYERGIWNKFVEYVQEKGDEELATLARAVLTTQNVKFKRCY